MSVIQTLPLASSLDSPRVTGGDALEAVRLFAESKHAPVRSDEKLTAAIDGRMEDARRPSFPDRHQLLPLIASQPVQHAVADRPDRAVAVFDEVGDRAERPAWLTGGDLSVA